MSSPTLPNTSCGRCHTAASDLGEPLKQCAGCHSVQCCSRDCQRRDWSSHKQQCLEIRAGGSGSRTRTTMRMNFLDLMGQGNQSRDTSDTIYYLKTSTPHIHDIAVSGPYHDLESVHAQASHNFGSECSPGRSALEDFVRDGRHMAFEHIASPINGDPNRIKKTTLLRRQDAHLAAKLPCPVWNVVVSELDSELKASGWAERNQMVPMKDMEIRQSYESEVAAKEKAREILQELVSSNEGCTSRIMRQTPFQAGVLDGQGPRFVVEVRYDGGLA